MMVASIPLPMAENRYLKRIVEVLQQLLGRQLVGTYLFGSAAYGAYRPGQSDLDVQAVIAEPLGTDRYLAIAGHLRHPRLPCPARRLEFVCYTRQAVDPPTRHPLFEINFNSGAEEPDHLSLDPAGESSHWFLLDIAMGRELGRALVGPPPATVFAPIPRRWQLEAILDSLAWHRAHEATSANSVLNACRGWRYAATGVMGSKYDGAVWALQQPGCPPVVAQAVAERTGGPVFNASQVDLLLERVDAAVRVALVREREQR